MQISKRERASTEYIGSPFDMQTDHREERVKGGKLERIALD